jgi:hypothetical protein
LLRFKDVTKRRENVKLSKQGNQAQYRWTRETMRSVGAAFVVPILALICAPVFTSNITPVIGDALVVADIIPGGIVYDVNKVGIERLAHFFVAQSHSSKDAHFKGRNSSGRSISGGAEKSIKAELFGFEVNESTVVTS